MNNEVDYDDAVYFANATVNPEERMYTESEQRRIRKVVEETASRDIAAAYSFVRRMMKPLVDAQEFKKAAFLRQVRIETIMGE